MSVSALPDSRAAQELVARHAWRTPLLSSRLLSEETGRNVQLNAQGVALAAALLGVRGVVVMAENATPSKVEATATWTSRSFVGCAGTKPDS